MRIGVKEKVLFSFATIDRMPYKLKLTESLCGEEVVSVVEVFREGDYIRVRTDSPCSTDQLFAKKIGEMKWDRKQIYELSLGDMYQMARSFGVKPFCPLPTLVMNAIWLEAGLLSESVALSSKTTMNTKRDEKTQVEVDLPLCGYKAYVNAQLTPAKRVKISVEIPCPDVNKYLKGIENKNFRDLEDCEEIYRLSKITDEKTCFIPLAVCVAYLVESKKLLVPKESRSIVEIEMFK